MAHSAQQTGINQTLGEKVNMLNLYFKLDGNRSIPCTLAEWRIFLQNPENCFVAEDWVSEGRIFTHFLGLARYHLPDQCPYLFETLMISRQQGKCLKRYKTLQQALQGHQECIRALRLEGNLK